MSCILSVPIYTNPNGFPKSSYNIKIYKLIGSITPKESMYKRKTTFF